MGAGKSAVGRALARKLRVPFFDLDALIERKQRRSVAEIFASKGEPAFRALESRELKKIMKAPARKRVIALGGGSLLKRENRVLVERKGILIHLSCSEKELWRRLSKEAGKRPLLSGPDARKNIRALRRARAAGYARAAFTVSTTDRTPAQIAAVIARRLS